MTNPTDIQPIVMKVLDELSERYFCDVDGDAGRRANVTLEIGGMFHANEPQSDGGVMTEPVGRVGER